MPQVPIEPEPSVSYGGPFPKVFDFNLPDSGFKTAIDTTDENQPVKFSKNELQFYEQLRAQFDNDEAFTETLKLFHLYVEGVIGADELFVISQPLFAALEDDMMFDLFKNIVLT